MNEMLTYSTDANGKTEVWERNLSQSHICLSQKLDLKMTAVVCIPVSGCTSWKTTPLSPSLPLSLSPLIYLFLSPFLFLSFLLCFKIFSSKVFYILSLQ